MIGYKETLSTMSNRGIEITDAQFSFAIMVVVGIDRYDAYKLSNKISKTKSDKNADFENKCKKECDILLEQNNMIVLINYLKDKYELQVSNAAMNTENIEITPKILKNLLGKIIKRSSENFDNTAYSDIIKAVSEYIKQFPMDNDDDEFNKHFIQIYPNFNFICSSCQHEGDAPIGVDFICKHCGKHYHWSEDEKRYF